MDKINEHKGAQKLIEDEINGKKYKEDYIDETWPLSVYVVIQCVGNDIDISSKLFPNLGKMNRSQMGVIIVSIDIICACVYILCRYISRSYVLSSYVLSSYVLSSYVSRNNFLRSYVSRKNIYVKV